MAFEEHFPDHQLHQLGNDRDRDPQEADSSTVVSHLPPADRGGAAWLFLFGSFMIEMFLWGFPFSFGVLQDYYTNHQPIARRPAGVSAVGTTCSVSLLSSPRITLLTTQRASCTSLHPCCSLRFNDGPISAVHVH